MENKTTYVPVTPAGSYAFNLERNTRDEAIKALLKEASHMPYKTWENFEKRGYTIEEFVKKD